ncbi:MAG: YadA-like family protein [Gammaproteobacteria bacterium]|nr:YadA-like family protein [Gammaproteobacteria bacterium]
MNKIYKVVFNKSTGTFVAVAEFAKCKSKPGKSSFIAKRKSLPSFRLAKLFLMMSMALGTASYAGKTQIGSVSDNNANAVGTNSVAVGDQSTAQSENSIAIGFKAVSLGFGAIVIGGEGSNEATQQYGIAMGQNSKSTNAYSIAIGNKTQSSGISSIALGEQTQAKGNASFAAGDETIAEGATSVALGNRTKALGIASFAIGNETFAKSDNSVALGNQTQALGGSSFASGEQSVAKGYTSVAMGYQANASSDDSIAIGNQVLSESAGAIAMGGYDTQQDTKVGGKALSLGSVAIGAGTIAGQKNGLQQAVALGYDSQATADKTVALGFEAISTADKTLALGSNTTASINGGIAIGSDSVTTANAGVTGVNPLDASIDEKSSTWTSTHAGFAVGNGKTVTRQITGVAAGKEDTDAVNVAQLNASIGWTAYNNNATPSGLTAEEITVKKQLSFNDGEATKATVYKDAKGSLGVKYDVLVDDDTIKINQDGKLIATAKTPETVGLTVTDGVVQSPQNPDIDKLVTASDLAKAINSTGFNVTTTNGTGGTPKLIKNGETIEFDQGANVTVTQTGKKFTIATAKDVQFDGIQLRDDNGPKITNDGNNIKVGDKDGKPTKITNIATGNINDSSTDAVNGSQIYALSEEIKKSSKTYFHVNENNGQTGADVNNQGGIRDLGGATGEFAVTAGVKSTGAGKRSLAMGYNSRADGDDSIAMGSGQALGVSSIAIGNNSLVADTLPKSPFPTTGGVAVGDSSQVTHNFGVAVGMFAEAKANGATAIGYNSTAEGQSSTALGNANYISKDAAMGATIGMDSILTVGKTGDKAYLSGEKIIAFDNNTINGDNDGGGVLSLGHKAGDPSSKGGPAFTRDKRMQITNLAGGVGDYDAVNVLQLKAVNKTANAGFIITGLSKTTATDTQIKPNDTLSIIGDSANKDFSKSDAGKNIYTVVNADDTVQIGLANDITIDSVTAGDTVLKDGSLVINSKETDPKKQVSISDSGISAGGNKVTNVEAGDINKDSTDAVNGSQLFDTNNQVAGNTKALGGGAKYDPKTNTYTEPQYNVVDANGNSLPDIKTANNVGDALTNLNSYVNKGFNVLERGTTKGTVTPTESIDFVDGQLTKAKVTTESDGVTKITFDVDSQGIAEAAQLPVVYTKEDGTKVYKRKNKFYDDPTAGNEVPVDEIIASMQNPDGTTSTATKLANVAAGTEDTDAVNVSQLGDVVTALGGGADINPDGTIKAPEYVITKTDGTKYAGANNVGDALTNLNAEIVKPITFTGNTNADTGSDGSQQALGSDFAILGDAGNTDFNKSGLGKNIYTKVEDGKVTIGLAKDIEVDNVTATDSVTIGDATNNTKLTSTADGLDVGGDKITNVADGDINDTSTDAINGSQIYNIADKNANNVFGGNATVANDGSTTFTDIGGTGEDTIHDAIKSINTATTTANKGFGIGGNSDIASDADGRTIKPTELFSIVGASGNTDFSKSDAGKNIYTQVSDNTITVALAEDLDVSSVTAKTVTATDGVTIGNSTNNTKLTSTADGLDVGGDKITNVADGDITSTSTDAVNGSQIHAISGANKDIFGGNATVNPDGTITMTDVGGTGKDNIHDAIKSINNSTVVANKGFGIAGNSDAASDEDGRTIKSTETFSIVGATGNTDFSKSDAGKNIYTQVTDNSITIGLANDIDVASVTAKKVKSETINATSTITIGDTSDPAKSTTLATDANGNLDVGGDKITNVANGDVSSTSTDAVNGSQLYDALNSVNNNVGSLYQAIGEARDDANAGTAAALAAASLPQPHDPGASMVSAAVGTYNGQSALSIGVSTISDNGKWIIKGALTQDTQSNTGASVGVGYQW